MLFIAENIRALRKEKDMTQEDVAEILGVSPQSISKWERGDTYPDITLLPSLANLFKTSLDALIGMDKINDTEAKAVVFMEGQKRILDGDHEGAISTYTKALKTFPNDGNIMLELALVLALDSQPEKLEQAMSLCERILTGHPAEHVQYVARAAMCYLFLKTGEKDQARNAAQKLPHVRVSRETVLDDIEKELAADGINECLNRIAYHENAAYDILVIDFALEMVPMVTEFNLLEGISETRSKAGKGKAGRHRIPTVRVRDNTDLALGQVRVRHYLEYVLDQCYTDPSEAAKEVLSALQKIGKA